MAQKDFKIGVLDTSNAKIRSNGFFTSLTSKSDLASNVALVLPDSVGINGQVLTTDGSGNLSFASTVNTTSIWVDGILNSNSALILESGGGLSIDSNTTTNIITLTADSSDVDLVQSNLSALPDSAANDHVTYTTLSGLINTVQENVVSSDNNVWVNANDHTTYTTITSNVYNTYVTLLGYVDGEVSNLVNGAPSQLDTLSELSAALENDANLAVTLTSQIGQVSSNASTNATNINLVQSNVTSLPDSAANDHVTYTTLSGLIDTVQSNIVSSDNNAWVNANDHATYTTLSGLVNTVNANVDALPDSAANDFATYTTLKGEVNTINSNLVSHISSLPDSAANDFATYTTLLGEINIVNSNVTAHIDALPDHVANDFATYTTLLGEINSVNSNVEALPDSAANDFTTYNTLVGLIDTVQGNVVSSDNNVWVNANDYATYSTLLSVIDTVQSNVYGIPDSAANDYATYTTLISRIDTVQDNVSTNTDNNAWVNANDHATYTTLAARIDTVQDNVSTNTDNNSWVNANDYATYTTLSGLVNTVQANLTTTDDSLDSFGTYANSTFAVAGQGSNFSDLDVDNITVAGDLTILGNTTTIESVNTVITDPLLLLNNGVSGSNTVDIGIIFNRGTDANAAFMYDESEDVFQFGFTQQGGDASDLIYSSLAGIRADAVRAGNVELGTGDDRNEITAYGNQDLIISANTLQATNIQIASNVIPSQNAVFSIGSPTAQIKDLYLSDGTLYIGSTSNISASTINVENFNVNSDGTISIPGVNIQADANAVDTVEIVASDLASNAHIQNQIEITVGDKDDLTSRVTTNLVAAINSTSVDLAALGSYANTTFATASDATSDQFIISSANTFTMGTSVSEANNVLVSISGLMQLPNDDYIVSGTTLTLNNTTPLPIGAAVEVRHLDVTGSGSGAGASGTESWSIVTSDTTLSANTNYFIDTSSSAIEVTLPASPTIGTGIKIVDMAGSAGTNNITVGRNSEKIQRLSQDLIVNVDSASFKLVFSNSTYGWIITEDTVTG